MAKKIQFPVHERVRRVVPASRSSARRWARISGTLESLGGLCFRLTWRLAGVALLVLFAVAAWSGWAFARNGQPDERGVELLRRGPLAVVMDSILHDARIENVSGGGETACLERVHARGLVERYPDGGLHPEETVDRYELVAAWKKLARTVHWHAGIPREGLVKALTEVGSGTVATTADLERLRSASAAFLGGGPILDTPKMRLKEILQGDHFPEEPSEGKAPTPRVAAGGSPEIAPIRRGVVLDALTGGAIPEAALSIAGTVVTSDAEGRFPVSGHPVGELVEFLVTADGYRSLTVKRRIEADKEDGLVFRLNPQRAVLEGRILSKTDGKPLSEVAISIGERRFITDRNGRFRVQGLKPGYVTLEIVGEGFHAARELVFIEEKKSVRTLRLDPNLG